MNDEGVAKFGEQLDPDGTQFVQPKAVRMVRHRGREFVMWRKREGGLAASIVMRRRRGTPANIADSS